MTLPVYFDAADTVIPVTASFTNANGVLTAPTTASCVVTDPNGNATTYNWNGSQTAPVLNQVYSASTGKFELDVQPFTGMTPPPSGLWHYVWVGSGTGLVNTVQVFTGSVRVRSLAGLSGQQRWYGGLEEFKSRLGDSYKNFNTTDDFELVTALTVSSAAINRYCGTHFFQLKETRTFRHESIYACPIDQVVPGSITSFKVDYTGDGIFDTAWTEGLNYQVYREGFSYNVNDLGVPRPYDYVEVILGTPVTPQGGQFFPFIWPFTHQDRIQIAATWGWQEVPDEVNEACLMLATDYFQSKNATFGIAGTGETGVLRVQQSPWIVDLLRPYKFVRKVVGV